MSNVWHSFLIGAQFPRLTGKSEPSQSKLLPSSLKCTLLLKCGLASTQDTDMNLDHKVNHPAELCCSLSAAAQLTPADRFVSARCLYGVTATQHNLFSNNKKKRNSWHKLIYCYDLIKSHQIKLYTYVFCFSYKNTTQNALHKNKTNTINDTKTSK